MSITHQKLLGHSKVLVKALKILVGHFVIVHIGMVQIEGGYDISHQSTVGQVFFEFVASILNKNINPK